MAAAVTGSTSIVGLIVALAGCTVALAMFGIVLVRLSRDLREARSECGEAWERVDEWTDHARRLEKELDSRGPYIAPAYQHPWPAPARANGVPRHAAPGDVTVSMPRVGEGT